MLLCASRPSPSSPPRSRRARPPQIVYHEQSYQVSWVRSKESGRPFPKLATHFSLRERVLGEDMSLDALSMIGLARLDSLQAQVEKIVADGIPGDLVETGCECLTLTQS
jgi:hypothetical protein